MSQDLNSIPYILFELDTGINTLQRLKASFEHAQQMEAIEARSKGHSLSLRAIYSVAAAQQRAQLLSLRDKADSFAFALSHYKVSCGVPAEPAVNLNELHKDHSLKTPL